VAGERIQQRDILLGGVSVLPHVPADSDVSEAAAGLDLGRQVGNVLRLRGRLPHGRGTGQRVVNRLDFSEERIEARWKGMAGGPDASAPPEQATWPRSGISLPDRPSARTSRRRLRSKRASPGVHASNVVFLNQPGSGPDAAQFGEVGIEGCRVRRPDLVIQVRDLIEYQARRWLAASGHASLSHWPV
jgi:hypothetical protein